MLKLKPARRETIKNAPWELRCTLTNQGKANFGTIKAAYEAQLDRSLSQSKFLDYLFESTASKLIQSVS